ncbi:MAG TPA: histidine kinase dimerization/phospho-acceptor domain-containing protein, partial [Myxococcales bacterium]|nr:histidine kinase dimerization/phospho-acceptor domain-containing protein [Myxococcales bacterium]
MTPGRQELLIALGVVFVLGLALTISRLVEARRSGLSFRLQVFLPLAATTLTLSAAFAVIVIDRFTARASVFAQRGAQDEARVVAELASRALDTEGTTLAQAAQQLSRVLPAFTNSEIATHVEIVDREGRTLIAVGAGEPESGAHIVVATAPIGDQGLVRVRKATFGMLALMSDVAPKVALLAFILALISAAVAVLIGQAVAGPIERLTRAAQRVAAGERQASLPEPRGREVRELTKALESMRRELEQRHALENFVADLSHELKNPIASIRASAEVLTEGAADEPETARRFALRIRESADKLQMLTQDLLSLARLEARGIHPQRRKVDLCGIAREAIDAQAPQAARRGVRVELRAPESAAVRGDPVWLRRALENLLGNAVQHSPDG